MEIIEYIKENPRKLLENITSYITILVGILGIIIAEGTGIGLSTEIIAQIVTMTAVLNRVLTYMRVTFLKKEISDLKKTAIEIEEDNFLME